MPCKPRYNLHEWQVGRLISGLLLPTSTRRKHAGGLQFAEKSGVPYKRCGFKRAYHEQSRVNLLVAVVVVTFMVIVAVVVLKT